MQNDKLLLCRKTIKVKTRSLCLFGCHSKSACAATWFTSLILLCASVLNWEVQHSAGFLSSLHGITWQVGEGGGVVIVVIRQSVANELNKLRYYGIEMGKRPKFWVRVRFAFFDDNSSVRILRQRNWKDVSVVVICYGLNVLVRFGSWQNLSCSVSSCWVWVLAHLYDRLYTEIRDAIARPGDPRNQN